MVSRHTERMIEKAKARRERDRERARARLVKSKKKFSRRHFLGWALGGAAFATIGTIAGLSRRRARQIRAQASKPASKKGERAETRESEPNKPVGKRPPVRKEFSDAELKANDFLLFRQEQAKRFGVKLTFKAAEKVGNRTVFFQPSDSLMRAIKSEISSKSRARNADRVLVYSIIEHESHFNPNAKSPVGARGLGQLMDIQIKQLKKLGFTVSNPYDIAQNVEGTVRTVKWMWANLEVNGSRQRFLVIPREKQLHMLFTAYNGGLSLANKLGPDYKSGYSKAVLPLYKKNLKSDPFK